MRNGQNKRMRGRNRNNKGHHGGGGGGGGGHHHNPLTRVYESNGPEVKIRGNAHHIAEKYLQLARDANSSGDRVMAENYLQHAEHYYRIMAAAAAQQAQYQAQQAALNAQQHGGQPQPQGQASQPQGQPQHQNGGSGASFSLTEGPTEEEGEEAEAS